MLRIRAGAAVRFGTFPVILSGVEIISQVF